MVVNKNHSTSNILTQSNYYNRDTDWNFLSKTIYWQFLQCESAAMAMMKDEYEPFDDNTPLIFGNYLHSYFESPEAHASFIDEHEKDLFKRGNKDNGLLKKYEQADLCINKMETDPQFQDLYQGKKEVIVTGVIDGVLWKGKIDCLDLERGIFLDLKTVDDIDKHVWVPERHEKLNFVLARGYDTQMAIYQELIRQTFDVECQAMILAVSKQKVPKARTILIPQGVLDSSLNEVIANQKRVEQVIHGEVKPVPCDHCNYCNSQSNFNDIYMVNDF